MKQKVPILQQLKRLVPERHENDIDINLMVVIGITRMMNVSMAIGHSNRVKGHEYQSFR